MMATDLRHGALCASCGTAVGALWFDTIDFQDLPRTDRLITVVRHELPRQYCGLLIGFQQYLDEREFEPAHSVETRHVQWDLRINGRPLDPYFRFNAILNRWGEAVNPVAIALEEGAALEMVARFTPRPSAAGAPEVEREHRRIGGRLMGRYWFRDDPYVGSRSP
jgi:hypothetical protein